MTDKKTPEKVYAVRKFTLKTGAACKLGQEVTGKEGYIKYLLDCGLVSDKKPVKK